MAEIIKFPARLDRDYRQLDQEIDNGSIDNVSPEIEEKIKEVLKKLIRKYPAFPDVPNLESLSLSVSEEDQARLQEWIDEHTEKIDQAVRKQVMRMLIDIAILTVEVETRD
ncbi:hypothetical protein [Isoalcanivorax indicus]|uniref:hypothetical protein n=1 Tax=Isoalcanivorax indicus TaxID=2202653 RepID=UPI000DBA287A|nr:hypothetical protein [Isoalcanivorax indicus]